MSELTDFINALPEGERKAIENKVSRSIAEIKAREATAKAPIYAIAGEVSPSELGWEQVTQTIWSRKEDGKSVEFAVNQKQVFLRLVEITPPAGVVRKKE